MTNDGIHFEAHDSPVEDSFDGPPQWSTWSKVVATRVDELLAHPFVSDRFLVKIKEWATELAKKGPTNESPDRFHIYRDCEVKISPTQRTSLATKYAQLAAIHHEVAKHEVAKEDGEQPRKIELGDIADVSSPSDRMACVSFQVLCSKVSESSDRDERIEQALKEVEQDLRDAGWQGEPNEDKTEAGDVVSIDESVGDESTSRAGIKALPKWMDAKAIADEFGWDPDRVRSELTKAYYGPGGAAVGKAASGKAQWRVDVPNAGGPQPKFLWNTILVIPYLKTIFQKD